MKRILGVFAGVALLAAPAFGQHAIRLFLAPEGVDGNTALGGIAPTMDNANVISNGTDVHRLYVWANVENEPTTADQYIGIGYNVVASDGTAVVGRSTWNYTNILTRWNAGAINQGTISGGDLVNVRMASPAGPGNFSVRSADHTGAFDLQHVPGAGPVVLGWIEVQGFGELRLGVGHNKIVATGFPGAEVDVYFGFGDEGDGIVGDQVDATSSMADAVIKPEPASLLLFGLAGVALLRRR